MRIAVAGTGTEIGKTHVGCALAKVWPAPGILALKPIESGGVEDARALSAACGVESVPHYALAEPISPHLAARREGRAIEVDEVVAWVAAREAEHGRAHTLVETAGGLFSPLAKGVNNASMVAALEPDVLLLVAPDRLGVLHDVTATLLAWQREAVTARIVVVMSAPAAADAATTSNAAELGALGITEVAAVFPRAPLDAEQTRAAAESLVAHLS